MTSTMKKLRNVRLEHSANCSLLSVEVVRMVGLGWKGQLSNDHEMTVTRKDSVTGQLELE